MEVEEPQLSEEQALVPETPIDYADESRVEVYQETPADKKRRAKYEERKRLMEGHRRPFEVKWSKNFEMWRQKNREVFTGHEAWRSNIYAPVVQPRVMGFISRLNDRMAEILCLPLTDDAIEKAMKKKVALDYSLDISGAKAAYDAAKAQAMKYGNGFVMDCWDESTNIIRRPIVVTNPDGSQELLTSPDGVIQYRTEEVPVHKEQAQTKHLDVFDVWMDPSAKMGPEDAEDCMIRFIVPTKEVRRMYWNTGTKLGKYVKSGMGNPTDASDERLRLVQEQAEANAQRTNLVKLDNGTWKDHTYSSGIEGAKREKAVELRYYINRADDVWQIWCGELCLLDEPIPYEQIATTDRPYGFKELPISMMVDIQEEWTPYGMGEIDLLENTQLHANKVRNERLDQTRLSTFKTYLVSPSSDVKVGDMYVEPNKILRVRDPQGVKELGSSPINPASFEEENLIMRDAELVSGMADISNSGQQRATDTATGMNIQVQSMETRLNEKLRNFERMFTRSVKQRAAIMAQFWPEQKLIAVVGNNGVDEHVITREDLAADVQISMKPGTAMPPNKLAIREQFMQAANILLPLPNVVQDEVVRRICEQFDILDWQGMIVSYRQAEMTSHAQAENEQMLKGTPAPVHEVYQQDNEIHLTEHMKLVQDPSFMLQPDAVKILVAEHIQEHQSRLLNSPVLPPNGEQQGGGAETVDPDSGSVPNPSNVTPVNPVVQPGADSFGA